MIKSSQPGITSSKLTIETLEQGVKYVQNYWRCSGAFIVNFEHIPHFVSSVSIINFEQVDASWVVVKLTLFYFSINPKNFPFPLSFPLKKRG